MICTIEQKQEFPADIEKVWNFISHPANLLLITPPELRFKMISENVPSEISHGTRLQYIVSPVFGIPLRWTSIISDVRKPFYFTDEQLKGPYHSWKHVHILRETAAGVEMTDTIQYEIGYGFAGTVLNRLLVRNKLKDILLFRFARLREILG